jgi:hypothetical protein
MLPRIYVSPVVFNFFIFSGNEQQQQDGQEPGEKSNLRCEQELKELTI